MLAIVTLNNAAFQIEKQIEEPKFNYRKTDWDMFKKKLNEAYTRDISQDRNLTPQEINTYLLEIDVTIQTIMQKTIPKIIPKNSINSYVTTEIVNLQKFKSHILTQLHKAQRTWPDVNEQAINILKY